ncbi:MFS transporter [Pseudooceanicola aestuarii]|uniref:MFS transporter n=1 Tax=Pseudooceanicola aestuarii TaxID=2697319 RepID=UPI0013D59FE1|nr:MFS transporter [Pseudooceanicola aestuarii]
MITRPVALLTLAIGIVGANSMVLAPITAAVARDLGGAPAEIVQAAAAFGLATALSALLLAPRGDAIGPDRALRQALVILLASLLASVLAPSKWALIGAQALGGIGAGMALPAIYSLAPQLAPKGEEKRTMGIVLSGWTLALVGGVAGSGFLAEWAGWRSVYMVLGGAMALIYLLILRMDLRVERLAQRPTSPVTALRVPGIWRGLFAAGALMLGFYGTYAFVGAHVADRIGLGAAGAAYVTLFYGTGFGLSTFLDKYLDRLPQNRAGALAFSGLALVYLAQAIWGADLAMLMGIALAWGIVQHLGLNFVVSRLAELDPAQRGAVLGLNSAVTYLAVTGGALLFRLPYEAGGLMACNLASAVCVALAAIECLLPDRRTGTA